MSSPNIQAFRTSKTKSPFVPRKPEIVTIGRTSVSLYPKVDSSMTDPEKALAYQHNKTALASADLDQRARILTLAERLDLMLMAESGLADWERKLSRSWAHFHHLTILSWHDAKGAAISNTTVAGDLSTLLPCQDGPVGNDKEQHFCWLNGIDKYPEHLLTIIEVKRCFHFGMYPP